MYNHQQSSLLQQQLEEFLSLSLNLGHWFYLNCTLFLGYEAIINTVEVFTGFSWLRLLVVDYFWLAVFADVIEHCWA